MKKFKKGDPRKDVSTASSAENSTSSVKLRANVTAATDRCTEDERNENLQKSVFG
jgi:hypothetical protein